MREPAVVSSPFVQRMSLSAIGTPCRPVRPSRSKRVGLGQGGLAARAQEGVDAAVGRIDAVEVGGDELAAGELARVEQLRRTAPPSGRASRSCVGGTRKPPSAGSGAFRSTSARGHDGRAASGRTWFVRSSACAVGSTPARSSAESSCTWPMIVESCSVIRADLVVGQAQPRQAGNVQHVVGRDRHRPRRIVKRRGVSVGGSSAAAPVTTWG